MVRQEKSGKKGCPPKPRLQKRPMIAQADALKLEKTFKTLANVTRIRMIHALAREKELCVTDLADALGMKPQAVSNQLRLMADKGILASRRNGNHILYRIADPCVHVLLDKGWCLTEETGQAYSS